MNEEGVLDVSHLPSYAFGRRDPMWWGVVLLMAIEGTGFALVLASYFYLKNQSTVWPPTPPGPVATTAAAATVAVLLLSILPAHQVNRAAYAGDLRGLRLWQSVSTAISLVAVVCRAFEFYTLPFAWDTNVYASLVWGALVLHTTHVGTGAVENLVLLTLLFRGPVERKHLVDIEVNGLYWYFVVAAWVPFFAVFHLEALVK